MKVFIKSTIFIICLSALSGFPVSVSAAEISSETQVLAEKIAQIRSNPYDYAKKLGLTPLSAETEFGFLSKNPENKTDLNSESLKSSEQLQEKAFYINNEISENISFPEYDNSSLNGFLSFAMTFNNYMEPETAVSIFIDDMFKREVSPDYSGKRFIMNFNYNLAGIDIKEGKAGNLNAYFITVCFASSASLNEAYVFNLLNSVRNNPFLADNYIFKHFSFADYFDYSLDSSKIKSQKPVFSGILPEDSQCEANCKTDIIEAFEYYYYEPEIENLFIEKAFSIFLIKELRDKRENPLIFNDSLKSGSLDIEVFGDGLEKKSAALYTFEGNVFEKAPPQSGETDEPEEKQFSGVYILIYKDINNDNLFNPGEGFCGSPVFMEDLHTGAKISFETDLSGRIQAFLPLDRTFNLSFEFEGEYRNHIFNTGSGDIYSEIKL